MKALYQAIASRLRDTGLFQAIDLFNGQFSDGADPRLLPAALVEFNLGNGIRLSGGRKVFDCIVIVRVFGDLYENTDALSPEHDEAVGRFFDIIEVTDKALDGIWQDGAFEQLVLREIKPDAEYTNMFAHQMIYDTQVYVGSERVATTLEGIEPVFVIN